MLVLTRKPGESITLGGGEIVITVVEVRGGEIVITVVEVRGDKVRLGIEAPKSMPVHRSEVYEAIRRAQEGESCS